MKIGLVNNSQVLHTWSTPDGQIATRWTLPNGNQISPIVLGWSDDDYAILEIEEFVIPEGKITTGAVSYTIENGKIIEQYEIEDAPIVEPVIERRMVKKSVVQSRLIEAGKMDLAYDLLTQNPTYFARWFAPDRPEVYFDDPDALLVLQAINADPEIIMAPEE